ncbi:hypothetical protein P775_16625 [Puniceibacterium antarcticum]|uniref:Diguanylate cyclase n=1 Tax=Puniceibacterium antarcticum TaxID=1206336 RepID=A0A2G8RC00_9RHOB|nr:bifunctional diguanylate cyclase/phosphodiesterase [Puniceibacterium antarcticum]PIL19067.1 hypothetical protein P775_16625 [Puniceibacterium antarcticum]
MDADAAEESKNRMTGRILAFQDQVSIIASDYHNWTDLYLNAKNLEYSKLASNYGVTADRGDVFQYAELFDGPFDAPVSWSAQLGLTPQKGMLSPITRAELRSRVFRLDFTRRETLDYFELRDGKLVMFSASYLLPEDDDLLEGSHLEAEAIAVIGKVISEKRLAEVEREFSISRLEIVVGGPSAVAVGFPLSGVTGEPIAWLQWLPPTPGTLLFWNMLPIMISGSLAFMLISFFAARLLRVKAEVLIDKEAISFRKARIDVLTNLPNRFALREHLDLLCQRADADCAIIAIDLVRFKQINDTVGHIGGDEFLIEFSRRLGRLADHATFVSRYGGDEFFIAICGSDELETTINEKCRHIIEISADPIRSNGVMFEVIASKGLAVSEYRFMDQDELLRRADRAMYSAKAHGSQKVVRYDSHMKAADLDYKRIEVELRRALVDGTGFEMYYQPIVSTREPSQASRYEALARWSCPTLGQVDPERFINVAETSGLILQLGWLLLDLVCQDIKNVDNTVINLNISPAQLMTPGFAEEFSNRISGYGIRPCRIEVEVTEQIVLRDDITIAKELSVLRACGFSLALDDFGTGYSSIGYLKRVKFDVLKIDRSFVRSSYNSNKDAQMVASMVGLARSLDLEIIAEGIETVQDADCLRGIGVDYLQGYYFGRPVPFKVVEANRRFYQIHDLEAGGVAVLSR